MKYILKIKNYLVVILAFSALLVNAAYAENINKKLLVFGDSLTAGYRLSFDEAFPAKLEEKLDEAGYGLIVVNGGVSGDTTSGGLARLEWTLNNFRPDYIILALGANDMLRATDPSVTRKNLEKMLDILKSKKIPVLLVGMKATPNLGKKYIKEYESMYADLAREYKTDFYPFFLEGVATEWTFLLDDGLHPNAGGVEEMVSRIFPTVEKFLKRNK